MNKVTFYVSIHKINTFLSILDVGEEIIMSFQRDKDNYLRCWKVTASKELYEAVKKLELI